MDMEGHASKESPDGHCSKEEETESSAEEESQFWKTIDSFKFYRLHVQEQVECTECEFRSLSLRHQSLVPGFLDKLAQISQCADHNQEVMQAIIHNALHMFQNEYDKRPLDAKEERPCRVDMDKVEDTMKLFVRDWSEAGQSERDSCYKPIVQEIQRLFPSDEWDVSRVSVLVPGAGLGRLAWEIAKLGYMCQGSELSPCLLLSSSFILHRCEEVNAFTLYPWIQQFSNVKCTADQMRPIKFPDINPQTLPRTSSFSLVAGDFLEGCSDPDMCDCLVTCFVLDTSPNVLEYVETIWKILKPAGVWINFGPLLYHFCCMGDEFGIELSYDEIKTAMVKLGFFIEMENTSMRTTFTENDRSMLNYDYDCVFFVARKPARLHQDGQLICPPSAKLPRLDMTSFEQNTKD